MNQGLFKKHLGNQGSHYEKYGNFSVMQREPSCTTTKSMLFAVSKDGWNTKEDTHKKRIVRMHTVVCQKARTSWAEATSNSERS